MIFGVDMSSSVNVDNKEKDTLILGERPTQGLDGTALTAVKNYLINFAEYNKTFCLSLHYNGANSYLFHNGAKIHKFQAKDSEINAIPLCAGNISKDFSVDNIKKTEFYGYVYNFSVDYDAAAVDDILDINKYKITKLQAFDSRYFWGKSHFENDVTQNYSVFQQMYRYF